MKIRNRAGLLIAIPPDTSQRWQCSSQAYEETPCKRLMNYWLKERTCKPGTLCRDSLQRTPTMRRLCGEWPVHSTRWDVWLNQTKTPCVFFQESEKYARAAIAEAPDRSDGYKWLAIALGAQSKYIDTETQVKHSREIKKNIEKAITLAPDDDISYLVLSRWHYKMSGLGYFARIFANMIYGELPKASLKECRKTFIAGHRTSRSGFPSLQPIQGLRPHGPCRRSQASIRKSPASSGHLPRRGGGTGQGQGKTGKQSIICPSCFMVFPDISRKRVFSPMHFRPQSTNTG